MVNRTDICCSLKPVSTPPLYSACPPLERVLISRWASRQHGATRPACVAALRNAGLLPRRLNPTAVCVCRAAGRGGRGHAHAARAGHLRVPVVGRLHGPRHQPAVGRDLAGFGPAAFAQPESQRPHQEHRPVHLHLGHHRYRRHAALSWLSPENTSP